MSYTIRGKTVGYDNIAAGSATGKERHTGDTGLAEVYPGGHGDSTVDSAKTANAFYTNIKQGEHSTDVDHENITVAAADPTAEILATSDLPGYTS